MMPWTQQRCIITADVTIILNLRRFVVGGMILIDYYYYLCKVSVGHAPTSFLPGFEERGGAAGGAGNLFTRYHK